MSASENFNASDLNMSHQSSTANNLSPAKLLDTIEPATPDSLRSLRIVLENATRTAIEEFIEAAGAELLSQTFVQFLQKENKSKTDDEILIELVRCFRGIGNLDIGREAC